MYAKEQLKKIEEIVNEDCANGRHVQRKIKDRMTSAGKCPQKFLQELQQLKVNKFTK